MERPTENKSSGASTTGHQAPPRGSARGNRFWTIAVTAVPILISVVALIVAVLSYQDQHSADIAAATASEAANANLVSFWTPNVHEVVVENLGQTPVFNVTLNFGDVLEVISSSPPLSQLKISELGLPADIGTLPPCSVATINTDPQVSRVSPPSNLHGLAAQRWQALEKTLEKVLSTLQTWPGLLTRPSTLVTEISFTDPNGRNWVRSITGELAMVTSPTSIDFLLQTAQTRQAAGCS